MSRISVLFAKDKAAWCREFFPEYAELFGGYPKGIPVDYGWAKGSTGAPELMPWAGWQREHGEIMADGRKLVPVPVDPNKRAPSIPYTFEYAGEDEYRAWCDRCNYFRNGQKTPLGGPGLDPSVFIGAVDNRRMGWLTKSEYQKRKARYEAGNLPVKPDWITCKTGIYQPMRGPTRRNPWGVNSAFIPTGLFTPTYISDKYGPDHFTPPAYIPLPRDEQGNVIIPTQIAYDRERWSAYL